MEEPLVCRINALTSSARERHQLLGEKLRSTVVELIELDNGYALVLDLGRLPLDAHGRPFCVVEVAEWVDLESRCCPFLDFGIDLSGKGGLVKLRLTGGKNVKPFLKTELGLLSAKGGQPCSQLGDRAEPRGRPGDAVRGPHRCTAGRRGC